MVQKIYVDFFKNERSPTVLCQKVIRGKKLYSVQPVKMPREIALRQQAFPFEKPQTVVAE